MQQDEQSQNFIMPVGRSQPTTPFLDSQNTGANGILPLSQTRPDQVQTARIGREGILKEDYIFHIETGKIKPNPNQPRKDFDEETLKDLAESIRQHGLLQPIVVSRIENSTPTGQVVEYQIIAGERRWRASQIAGLPTMPAIIKDSTEKTRLELGLVENIQRENLNPIEMALAFKRLIEEFNVPYRQIADKVGKSPSAVSNILRLLNLPPEIQQALSSNKIFEGHARAILALTSSDQQFKLFEAILRGGMTVREAEDESRRMKLEKGRKVRSAVVLNPYFRELIDRLENILGTKVTLVPKGEGGRLTIEYYSPDELEELIRKLAPENTDTTVV